MSVPATLLAALRKARSPALPTDLDLRRARLAARFAARRTWVPAVDALARRLRPARRARVATRVDGLAREVRALRVVRCAVAMILSLVSKNGTDRVTRVISARRPGPHSPTAIATKDSTGAFRSAMIHASRRTLGRLKEEMT